MNPPTIVRHVTVAAVLTVAIIGCGPARTPQDVMADIIQVKLKLDRLNRKQETERKSEATPHQPGETLIKTASNDNGSPSAGALSARLAELKLELRQLANRKAGASPDDKKKPAAADEESARLLELLRSEKSITGRVSAKIVDVKTGKPLTARIRIADQYGGTVGGKDGVWATGSFSSLVLTGPVTVHVSRGPAYRPWHRRLYLLPGMHQRLVVRLSPERDSVLKSGGWVAVDLHALYSRGVADNSWTQANAIVQAARGEGVDVLALTSAGGRKGIDLDDAALHGTKPMVLAAAPLWRAGLRGRAYALSEELAAMTEPVTGPGLSLGERAVSAVRRGRLVICRHPTRAREADPHSEILPLAPHLRDFYRDASIALPGLAAELPLLLSAGGPEPSGSLVGALDLDISNDAEQQLWHFLLNRGHRIPAVYTVPEASQGRDVPGATTFVQVKGPTTRRKIIDAIRHGRAMVSQGPLVFLSMTPADSPKSEVGFGPGDRIPAGNKSFRIRVRAYAEPDARVGIERIELIRNGEVRFAERGATGQSWLESRMLHRETEAAWYVARVRQRSDRDGSIKVAWTNPIYITPPGGGPAAAPLLTAVTGRVTGAPAGSVITVEAFVGGRRVAQTHAGAEGNYALRCSPYARIVARAPGVLPDQKRVYSATRSDELVRRIHCQLDGAGPSALRDRKTWSMARMLAGRAQVNLHLRALPRTP